jgi:hypothetical protein
MSPEAQVTLVTGVLVPVVAVFIVGLKRKLKLSDEAADAVSAGSPLRPKDSDQAFIALAHKVNEQGNQLSDLRIYLPRVIDWGHDGWTYAPEDQRKPIPTPPPGLTL